MKSNLWATITYGQNLDFKELSGSTSDSGTALAVAIMDYFDKRRKVRCHNVAVDFTAQSAKSCEELRASQARIRGEGRSLPVPLFEFERMEADYGWFSFQQDCSDRNRRGLFVVRLRWVGKRIG